MRRLFAISLTSIIYFLVSVSPIHAASIDLFGTARTVGTGSFEKFPFMHTSPVTVNITGLSGYIKLTSSAEDIKQLLAILLVYPTSAGKCPSVNNLSGIHAQNIAQFILKIARPGTVQLPTNFTFPIKVPISGCLVVRLDGGPGRNVLLESHITLNYDRTTPPSPAPYFLPLDDEFCFGRTNGCFRATTSLSPKSAYKYEWPITKPVKLWSLTGNNAAATITPPPGAWSIKSDYYIYRDCKNSGISGPANYYGSIPTSATHLLSLPMANSGVSEVNVVGKKNFSSYTLDKGDCLVHLVSSNADGGSFNPESQIGALLQPIDSTPSPLPSPRPGDLIGDGHVNLYDYNELVAGFGIQYTIFDYNNIVANYGQ